MRSSAASASEWCRRLSRLLVVGGASAASAWNSGPEFVPVVTSLGLLCTQPHVSTNRSGACGFSVSTVSLGVPGRAT